MTEFDRCPHPISTVSVLLLTVTSAVTRQSVMSGVMSTAMKGAGFSSSCPKLIHHTSNVHVFM